VNDSTDGRVASHDSSKQQGGHSNG
jgi:hypothetical protein